jgi:hypothetical protein
MGYPAHARRGRNTDVGKHGRGSYQRATVEAGQIMNASAGNAPAIRARVCEGLSFPSVQLEKNWRAVDAPLISADPGVSGKTNRTN